MPGIGMLSLTHPDRRTRDPGRSSTPMGEASLLILIICPNRIRTSRVSHEVVDVDVVVVQEAGAKVSPATRPLTNRNEETFQQFLN